MGPAAFPPYTRVRGRVVSIGGSCNAVKARRVSFLYRSRFRIIPSVPILSRYLLRSYLAPFALALGVFLFLLLMSHFLRLFNLAMMKGIPLTWILACFARLLPYFLSLALPMAFLVALLLTLGQLSEHGEIMALRASGYSFREMLAPFLALAVLLSLLLLYVNHKASPEGFHSFRNSYTQAASRVSRMDLEPRVLTRIGDWEFYAEVVEPRSGRMSGVRLIKGRGDYKRLRILAPTGSARVEPGRGVRLELLSGSLQWPNEDPTANTTSTFGRYQLFVPFASQESGRPLDMQELNTFRLRGWLKDPALDEQKRREYATETAVRSAGALAPLVLFWIACPLGLSLEKKSRAAGFTLSLAVMFGYYGLLALGIGLGRRSLALSPWAPWLPDAAALALGAWLWRRRLGAATGA